MVFLVGMGLGFMTNALIITIQSAVPWHQRGVATATNMFMRSLGATVGVAALGAVLNASMAASAHGIAVTELVNQLLDPTAHGELSDRAQVIDALALGMQRVFWAVLAMAAVGGAIATALPGKVEPAA
jgi:hypothetical protein